MSASYLTTRGRKRHIRQAALQVINYINGTPTKFPKIGFNLFGISIFKSQNKDQIELSHKRFNKKSLHKDQAATTKNMERNAN